MEYYSAHRIQKLEGLEHIRHRPGMYIGRTDEEGLKLCLMELVANSVEQHVVGMCSSVLVTIHSDGSASVTDDGPGISVAAVPRHNNVPFVELIFTVAHYVSERNRATPFRLGFAGVGLTCINALSEWTEATTCSGTETFRMVFGRGKVTQPLQKTSDSVKQGTVIRFKPDAEIFGEKTFNNSGVAKELEQVAMLHPGLDVWFVDERTNSAARALVSHYKFANGCVDYLKLLYCHECRIHPEPVQITSEAGKIKVAIAFQFSESANTMLLSFVNSSLTRQGGTHLNGFLQGLTDGVNQFAGQCEPFKQYEIRDGLSAIVAVWFADPKYAGAAKWQLINPEIEAVVRKLTFEKVRAWIGEIQASNDWFIDRLAERRSSRLSLGEN